MDLRAGDHCKQRHLGISGWGATVNSDTLVTERLGKPTWPHRGFNEEAGETRLRTDRLGSDTWKSRNGRSLRYLGISGWGIAVNSDTWGPQGEESLFIAMLWELSGRVDEGSGCGIRDKFELR